MTIESIMNMHADDVVMPGDDISQESFGKESNVEGLAVDRESAEASTSDAVEEVEKENSGDSENMLADNTTRSNDPSDLLPSPTKKTESPAKANVPNSLASTLDEEASEVLEQPSINADEPVVEDGQEKGKKRRSDVLPEDLTCELSPGKKQALEDGEKEGEQLHTEVIKSSETGEPKVSEMEIEKSDKEIFNEPATTPDSEALIVSESQEYDPNSDPIIIAARERRMEMEAKLEQTKELMDKMKQGLINLTTNIDEVKGSFQDLNERADRVVEESKAHTEGLKEMKERMAKINEVRAENDAKFRDQVTALKEKVMGILEKEKENLAQVKAIDEEVKQIADTTEEALAEVKATEETAMATE